MYIGGNTEKVWAQNLETNRIWDFFREKMAEVLIRILFEHTPPCYAWAPLHRNRGEVGWWVLSVDGEDFVNDVLAVSAPGEGGEVAFPSEFDVLSRAAHQTVGHGVVCHRELEFVAAQAIHIVIGGLETALNHLAFVGLEYYALPLEVSRATASGPVIMNARSISIKEKATADSSVDISGLLFSLNIQSQSL